MTDSAMTNSPIVAQRGAIAVSPASDLPMRAAAGAESGLALCLEPPALAQSGRDFHCHHLLGMAGALLAVPLLASFKIVADRVGALRPAAEFLSPKGVTRLGVHIFCHPRKSGDPVFHRRFNRLLDSRLRGNDKRGFPAFQTKLIPL